MDTTRRDPRGHVQVTALAACQSQQPARLLSRRSLFASTLAIGTGALFAGWRVRADESLALRRKLAPGTVDVHHHFAPPVFKESNDRFLARLYGDVPEPIRNWTPQRSLEGMDRTGIAKSVLFTSARTPGPETSTETFRAQARSANDYAARMVQDHPDRFAQFAFVPMPDVDGTLREIAYCLDVLKAVGVGMMTSYGNRWQGHPDFDPVLQELNRRKAVVMCHPLPAACCTALMPDVAPRESQLIEFPYDTGRAVVSLLMSGALVKYRDIRWLLSHCGDTVPVLSGRMRNVFTQLPEEQVARIAPQGLDAELRRFYCDTADAAYGPSMAAALDYMPHDHLLYGTDYPYVPLELNANELHARRLPKADMAGILRANALKLLPRL